MQVHEEEHERGDRNHERDHQCGKLRLVHDTYFVVFALQETCGLQCRGDRLVEQEYQCGVEDRFCQVEGKEERQNQRADILNGDVHVERGDEEVCGEHDHGHGDHGGDHAEHCAEHAAVACVDEAAEADENHAGDDVHDVAVKTGAADGREFDGGDDQRHGEAVGGTEEHGADGHDGVLEVEGEEGYFEVEEDAAYVGERAEDADCGEGTCLFVGEERSGFV